MDFGLSDEQRLLEETLRTTVLKGKPEVFPALCVIIDKLDRIGADSVIELLREPSGLVALPEADARSVLSWLELRDLAVAGKLMQADSPAITNVRGRGLMLAFDLPDGAMRDRVRQECWDKGLATLPCGPRSLRFRPPLVFSEADAERSLTTLREVLA